MHENVTMKPTEIVLRREGTRGRNRKGEFDQGTLYACRWKYHKGTPLSHVPMAHAYNPSYSVSRNQKNWVQSQTKQVVHETLS
jgi:hypothetical protein